MPKYLNSILEYETTVLLLVESYAMEVKIVHIALCSVLSKDYKNYKKSG